MALRHHEQGRLRLPCAAPRLHPERHHLGPLLTRSAPRSIARHRARAKRGGGSPRGRRPARGRCCPRRGAAHLLLPDVCRRHALHRRRARTARVPRQQVLAPGQGEGDGLGRGGRGRDWGRGQVHDGELGLVQRRVLDGDNCLAPRRRGGCRERRPAADRAPRHARVARGGGPHQPRARRAAVPLLRHRLLHLRGAERPDPRAARSDGRVGTLLRGSDGAARVATLLAGHGARLRADGPEASTPRRHVRGGVPRHQPLAALVLGTPARHRQQVGGPAERVACGDAQRPLHRDDGALRHHHHLPVRRGRLCARE
mmetsp:Transcript_23794/g.70422  ORF Transcript_23794/g.70422 Transcript_23794/m.70422 type:complete len:313 (+) Transcript_23794:459-1397(+)